jgi:AcrR family transcriptional regulator
MIGNVEHRNQRRQVCDRRGRPRKISSTLLANALRLRLDARLTMRELADALGVSRMTLYRLFSCKDIALS